MSSSSTISDDAGMVHAFFKFVNNDILTYGIHGCCAALHTHRREGAKDGHNRQSKPLPGHPKMRDVETRNYT